MKTDNASTQYCRSFAKGLFLLRLFTSESPELSGGQIVSQMELHKTTTYRMLSTLCDQGFLVRSEVTGKYSVGAALYVLGSLFQYTNDLQKAGGPVVRVVNELTYECTNLGILSDTAVVYMLREEAKHDFRWSRPIGSTMPAYASALGKAMLSGLTDEEINVRYPSEHLASLTPSTVATRTDLKRELAEIRRTGVAIDPEGCIPLVVGFGSPVRDHCGETVAAISLSVPVFRLDPDKRQILSEFVRLGASLISYRLGHRDSAVAVRTLEQLRAWWTHSQSSRSRAETTRPTLDGNEQTSLPSEP